MASIPYQGKIELFNRFLGINSTDLLKLKLYSTDRTPSDSDTISEYDELDGNGYSAIEIPLSDWSVVSDGTNIKAILQTQTFTFSGLITRISGLYLTSNDDSLLIYAERFSDGPYLNYNLGTLEIDLELVIGV
jgi:hypothetical protein